ncbi:hypothetical protein EP18_14225 [Lysinibacillus sphaericus]|nr:hypothetical protein EP18_18625 [Lysinibacillus sphaericus]KEK11126.1 hypothetical protein EP18_14225 [Lysinibacillus sphaericus]
MRKLMGVKAIINGNKIGAMMFLMLILVVIALFTFDPNIENGFKLHHWINLIATVGGNYLGICILFEKKGQKNKSSS